MRYLFLPVLAALVAADALAIDYNEVALVKEEWTEGWRAVDADTVPLLVSCRRVSFSARTPEAPISPDSDDPRVTTSDSSLLYWPPDQCNIGVDSSNHWTKYFHFRARSLKDLGQHTVVCDGYAFPVSSCTSAYSPPCNIVCDARAANIALMVRYFVDVINIPPNVSPSFSPVNLAWNSTVKLHANGSDYDNPYPGDTNKYWWAYAQRPKGARGELIDFETADPSITFKGEEDIGTWRFYLEVDDNEGERRIYENAIEFTVPNAPPSFEIKGSSEVVVNNSIQLNSSKTTDDDGGNLTFVWDILQSPSQSPQNNYSTSSSISIPTTRADLGVWVFRLTATDNEGASVSKTFTVNVVNLKPRIVFSGPSKLNAGQDLVLSTTVLQDDDGGPLSFRWEVVQEPGTTGTPLPYVISTTSVVSKPALWRYGTWIFRLTATDDEGESVQKEFSVLVDMGPWVFTSGINGNEYAEAEYPLIINRGDYLLLYGSAEDPDSPCTDSANRCHRTDGRPVSVSPGIVKYQWNIIQIPEGVNYDMGYYEVGPIHQSFPGVADTGHDLDFGFAQIPEGLWGFELRAWDAEGNESAYPIYVEVQQSAVPPYVYFTSTIPSGGRVVTPLSGVLPQEISFDGSYSYDPDNEIPYETSANFGLGITHYTWEAIPPTPQCNAPELPDEYDAVSAVLYPAGTTIPPECQGRWRVRLTVTDDDGVQKSSVHEVSFSIGNCSGQVCLDTPRQIAPAVLSLAGTGGVLIGYHISSALYDETVFGLGVQAKLEVFSEDDSVTPAYTALSGTATQSSRGQPLLFYWTGITQSGTRVQEGKYFHIKLSLLDANGNVLGSQTEYRAITSEPMTVTFNEPATKYVMIYASEAMSFTLTGAQSPVDSYRGTLRDVDGNVVATFTAPASATSIPVKYTTPGIYTFELFAIRGSSAISLGTHPLTVYNMHLSLITTDNSKPTAMLVNSDDDNSNGVQDSEDAFLTGDDEVQRLTVYLQPRELAGTLTLEHTLGEGVLKAWTTLSKTEEVPLPRSWNFPGSDADWQIWARYSGGLTYYLEALKEGAGEVRLRFTPADGVSLTSTVQLSTFVLDAVQDTNNDHVIDEFDTVLRTVHPARWDNAYDAAFNVRNNADPDHFVDLDPSRFYLRARGPKLDVDPIKVDILQLWFSTAVQMSGYDGSNIMQIKESGPNTSTMVSRALMLTGPDIEGIPRMDTDDGFPVHDGVSKVVTDGSLGDRTWRAPIDGNMSISYTPPNGSTLDWRLPVCGDARRKVPLRVHVFLEPFDDRGVDADGNPATADTFGANNGKFDYVDANGNGQHDLGERSEPYVDFSNPMTDGIARSGDAAGVLGARGPLMSTTDILREIRHTDSLWSPACIKTEVMGGSILVEEAPLYGATNIIMDGVMTEPEISVLYQKYSASMTEDVIDVFYGTAQNIGGGSSGLAFPPLYQTAAVPHGEKLFTIIQSNISTYPTLAHELAHLLTNTGDSAGNKTTFYPKNVTPDPLTAVNSGRRMPEWVALDARQPRPAGNLAAHGNRQLQAY